MIHAHVYANNAYNTHCAIPCGALEEVDEILNTIQAQYNTFYGTQYILNLKGHGCIIMGATVEDIKNISYYGRPMPEVI